MSLEVLISLIAILPLLGGLLSFVLTDRVKFISAVFIGGSFLFSLYLLFSLHNPYIIKWEWLTDFQVGIMVDKPAAILVVLVNLISLLVHLFSLEYMKNDTAQNRYFTKLGFFTFSMLGLLISDSLVLLFIFWEFVGIASYILIGFWFQKENISSSARMAFMVNRIADVALFAGILIVNGNGKPIFISGFDETLLFLPSLLITIGAFGKSAQLPFSGWLVKAMVGPTPISAFIHAATMVAAGVYLLFRIGPFLDPTVLMIIAVVGVTTALYGAISAITQNDIKKVLAYSTISQLGYMMLGIGVGAGEASVFYLWTHAFFKAGLFLGAGVIIHSFHQLNVVDAQDMRLMGGLRKKLPWTFISFLICGLALAGIPLFSGFMSKEGILMASWSWADQLGTWAYLVPDVALITVLITAFYVGRLIVLVFLGESRSDKISSIEFIESSYIKVPLSLLALGSIWLVYNLNPFSHHSIIESFIGKNGLNTGSFINSVSVGIAIFLSVAGILFSFYLFKPGSIFSVGYRDSNPLRTLGGRLVFNGFYFTKAYRHIGEAVYSTAKGSSWVEKRIDRLLHFIAIGAVVLAKVLSIVDRLVVDGAVNLSAWIAKIFGTITQGMHSRESQWQIIWLLIAFVLILTWILFF